MHIASPVVEKAFLSRLSYRCDSASIAASCFFPSVEGNVIFYHFGLTKCTIYCKKNVPVFVPIFPYTVTILIFQIKRINSSEKWFNYVVAFFYFLGRSDDAKRRKKEDMALDE